MSLTKTDLIKELAGAQCRCGKAKRRATTFCTGCYFSLTQRMQLSLYQKMGAGYEEAYEEAIKYLDAKIKTGTQ